MYSYIAKNGQSRNGLIEPIEAHLFRENWNDFKKNSKETQINVSERISMYVNL